MRQCEYEEILKQLTDSIESVDSAMQVTDASRETVMAIFMRKRQLEVKLQMKGIQAKGHEPDHWYRQWQETGDILLLASTLGLPACLMARMVLKGWNDSDKQKGRVTQLLQNPQLIEDEALRCSVSHCIRMDPIYGPDQDRMRQEAGKWGEDTLYSALTSLNIPFWMEQEMRQQGYAKTPDAILLEPIAIDGSIVRWIESKAWFGDPTGHQEALKEQFFPYVNRFGPGMVIYWHGFVDELNVWHERGILLASSFPTRITRIKF